MFKIKNIDDLDSLEFINIDGNTAKAIIKEELKKSAIEVDKQIKGLIMILEEGSKDGKQPMIHRNYVIEKLNMILGNGINFHPSIREKLE